MKTHGTNFNFSFISWGYRHILKCRVNWFHFTMGYIDWRVVQRWHASKDRIYSAASCSSILSLASLGFELIALPASWGWFRWKMARMYFYGEYASEWRWQVLSSAVTTEVLSAYQGHFMRLSYFANLRATLNPPYLQVAEGLLTAQKPTLSILASTWPFCGRNRGSLSDWNPRGSS